MDPQAADSAPAFPDKPADCLDNPEACPDKDKESGLAKIRVSAARSADSRNRQVRGQVQGRRRRSSNLTFSVASFPEMKKPRVKRGTSHLRNRDRLPSTYTLKDEPQPQVLFTFGLLNLKPAPSSVSM